MQYASGAIMKNLCAKLLENKKINKKSYINTIKNRCE